MQKALRLSQVFGGLILFVFLFFFLPSASSANTVLKDIKIELGIETGNGPEDYADADSTVEKGRFVEYKIAVTNTGNTPHKNIFVQMDDPDYMTYITGTTYMDSGSGYDDYIFDLSDKSALSAGYILDNIDSGQSIIFYIKYQVDVPENVLDDPLYTLAWASAWGIYSGIPIFSPAIETTISGEEKAIIQGAVEISSGLGGAVKPGMQITYNYKLHNVGGVATSPITITTNLPENTICISGCGTFTLNSLQPSEEGILHTMIVEVKKDLPAGVKITNIGFTASGDNFDTLLHTESSELLVIDNDGYAMALNEFMLIINQVPNFILNSADGNPRSDEADLTETQYSLLYGGRGQQYTYPNISDTGYSTTTKICGQYPHPNKFGAYFYAYNSNGSQDSESLYGIGLLSNPLQFHINTVLPDTSPKLEFTVNNPVYSFGDTWEINEYMKQGFHIDIPSIFTESRAIENGAMGIVSSEVNTNISEDLWQYRYAGRDEILCTYCYSCGEDSTCCDDYYRPVYTWQKVSSQPIQLKDDDTAHISVYTSTAWLKTQGGHIGTNDRFTNEAGELNVNLVDLAFYEDVNNKDDYYYRENSYLKDGHKTSSWEYTPPGEFNAEYMIFGNLGTGNMTTNCGQGPEYDCTAWYSTGFTPFRNDNEETSFVQKGEAYDRENNPRNYEKDMFERKKFGEVKENELQSPLTGIVELGHNVTWKNSGDIIIGTKSENDEVEVVTFSGGQSRIYTEGDVYIYADIKYKTSSSYNYNDITAVRIDARNIYVDGKVQDLEVMLLARDTFKSGVSKKQLRIFGDVIAQKTFWERQPILEYDVTTVNQPSEYIIEDLRKYIVPVPGDREIPDDYNIWRQVNPATGEVLDGY